MQPVTPQGHLVKQLMPLSIGGGAPPCGHRGGPESGPGSGRRIGSPGGLVSQNGGALFGRTWRGARGGNRGDHHPEEPPGRWMA